MAGSRGEGWKSAPRRAAGRALLDGPLGESRIVRAVGGDPGNTGRLLQRMAAEGIVEIESDRKPRVWRLAYGQDEKLREALEQSQPVGELRKGQRLLLVDVCAVGEGAFAKTLRRRALLGGLVWAAKVEGTKGQYILVLDREAAALETSSVVTLLEASGVACTRVLIEEVQTPEAFVRTLSALRAVQA